MTESIQPVASALAAADIGEVIRRMPGLRRAVTLAERNRPAAEPCPCRWCADRARRHRD